MCVPDISFGLDVMFSATVTFVLYENHLNQFTQ
jgi:hypothetical protein